MRLLTWWLGLVGANVAAAELVAGVAADLVGVLPAGQEPPMQSQVSPTGGTLIDLGHAAILAPAARVAVGAERDGRNPRLLLVRVGPGARSKRSLGRRAGGSVREGLPHERQVGYSVTRPDE